MKPKWINIIMAVLVAGGLFGTIVVQNLSQGLGPGFASGNGRIEATEIDIATKLAGRIEEIFVDEGDFVKKGQLLARMDTKALQAQLSQAEAKVRQAQYGLQTADAVVAQRESEKKTAEAVVRQREAELVALNKSFLRLEGLVKQKVSTEQELDDSRANMESGKAALAAATSQVHSAQAGIDAAKSQRVEAESAIEAAEAEVVRLKADLEDSQLKSPRDGRIQYRIAQPGEVLSAGGRVLNMVDVSDVYMTFFLPAAQAGRVAMDQEVRLIIDPVPQYVVPSNVSYVASVAQFTPKTVETESEREKLMFRIKARISPELLKQHMAKVKTGVPGMAYLKLDPEAEWPEKLQIKVPES